MKYVTAILSCFKDKANGTNQAILDTWGKTMPPGWDLRIFLGGSDWEPEHDPGVKEDIGEAGTLAVMDKDKAKPFIEKNWTGISKSEVVLLNAPDGYLGLAWKGKYARQWCLDQGYDGMFIGRADTYIRPDRVANAVGDFMNFPATAQVFIAAPSKGYPHHAPCPHGGFGYFLRRDAAEAIANDPVRHYSEDQNVAFALHSHGIPIRPDSRFGQKLKIVTYSSFTLHLSTKNDKWNPKIIVDQWHRERDRKDAYPGWDGLCRKCSGSEFVPALHGPRCLRCGAHFSMVKK